MCLIVETTGVLMKPMWYISMSAINKLEQVNPHPGSVAYTHQLYPQLIINDCTGMQRGDPSQSHLAQ